MHQREVRSSNARAAVGSLRTMRVEDGLRPDARGQARLSRARAPGRAREPLDADGARVIQALLGHDKPETMARYTRVATGMIAQIESPLKGLNAPRHRQAKRDAEKPPAR